MIKSLVSFFISKSILNHILLIFLFLLGIFAYIKIPKEIFPPFTLDAISIRGHYAGASPDILDKMAVQSIEDDLNNLSEVSTLKSTIKNGVFSIKADIKDGGDIDKALSDAKDIISNVKRDLPTDMDEPTVKKIIASFPLVNIAIASSADIEDLLEIATKLKQSLSSIDHLSNITIRGDVDKELQFKLNSKKIDALNIDRDMVIASLSNLSSIFPIGFIKQKGEHLFISTFNGAKDVVELKNTLLTIGDKKVYLKNIVDVSFALGDPDQISHFNGVRNVSVDINKDKHGNAIALVKSIRKELEKYKNEYKDFQFDVYIDTSIWIRNRLNTVVSNILFGLILVGLSIFVFINARIAIVVSIGIPTSFIIGLIATQMLGYSLNMLSLLGALIALGMLVDEAIVVAENIQRHLEEGDDPKTAAINGASEMFPAVLTATATTIFAFLPLLVMSGEMGVFMKILPIMITILLISSLFEAFFFLPLHSKEILKKDHKKNRSNSFWVWAKKFYTKVLQLLLKWRKSFLLGFTAIIFTLISMLLANSKFQLFPDFDTTQVYISGKVDKNFKLSETAELVTGIEKKIIGKLGESNVSSITSVCGFKLDQKSIPHISENYFHIFVNLHERAPDNFFNSFINPVLSPEYDNSDMIRHYTAKEIAKNIKKLTVEFNNDANFKEFNIVVPGAGIVESDIAISFWGDDNEVKKQITKLQQKIQSIDGVFNISIDQDRGESELKLKVNSYGYSLGFNESVISRTLKPLFLEAEISKMFYEGELISITAEDEGKDKISTLKNLFISIPNSYKKVRLSEVVEFIEKPSFATLFKEDGKKIWTLTGSLDKDKLTSSEFLKLINEDLENIKKTSVEFEIKGEEKENKKIQKEMMQASIIATFLIFIALIWMFDSIKLSLFVLSTIPLSLFGVLIGHIIMDINLTLTGMLGVVGLAGVVVNDGIIMIDFLRHANTHEEFIQKATLRLRPILLTSITTVLGLSTLILFASGQAVILQPMAISLGFGIAWATVLNLFFLPLLFAFFHRIR